MRSRSKLSEAQREQVVDLLEQGTGHWAAASKVKVGSHPAERLYDRWPLHGRPCLMEQPTNTQYPFEIKKEIVDRHLAGETAMDLAAEFHVSSKHLVKTWVREWRRHGDEALQPKRKGRLPGPSVKPPLS